MGRITTKIVIKELKRIKAKVSKKHKIDQMILFGSRSRGEELLSSDVDLLVVSPYFKNIPFRKRPDIFLDAWKFSVDLEVICYSPEEFFRKQKEYGIVREAVKEGEII